MKPISPKVKALLEQVEKMDAQELSEFRYLLGKNLGLQHLNTDIKDDPNGDTPAGVPRVPKQPILTGTAQRIIESL